MGAAGITGALSLAVYTIVTANDAGWASARTLLLFAASAVLLAAFVAIERIRREPLVRLGIFKTPNLAVANTVMALLGAAWIPMWFFLNFYLQRILGYNAFESGAALLPMTAVIMLVMIGVTGRVVARYGFKSPMVVGLGLLAAGIALLSGAGRRQLRRRRPHPVVDRCSRNVAHLHSDADRRALSRSARRGRSCLRACQYDLSGSALGPAVASAVAVAATNGTASPALNDGYSAAFFTAAAVAVGAALLAIAKLRSPAAAEATGETKVGAGERRLTRRRRA